MKEILSLTFPNMEILENVMMSDYTTMKVGGSCPLMIFPKTNKELVELLTFLDNQSLNYYILGKGSNLVINDEGLDLIVVNTEKCTSISNDADRDQIKASAGVKLADLAEFSLQNALSGIEFASGIPGSVGGAIYMNAGAYGGEMKDILLSSLVYIPKTGLKTLENREHNFSYRHSVLSENKAILIEAVFQLKKGDKNEIQSQIKDLTDQRASKQPLEYPSSGSVFKRPEGYFAGKLIMDSGLMGYQIGGAMVSHKHAGFIVNVGNAKAQDILDLIQHIQNTVFEKFSVRLIPELKFVLQDGSLKRW